MCQVSLQCKKVQAALARAELDSPAMQGQRLGRKPMNLTMEETLGVGREPGNSPAWPSGRNLHTCNTQGLGTVQRSFSEFRGSGLKDVYLGAKDV